MSEADAPIPSYQVAMRTAIIHEMFVHTADQDYITARWAMSNRMMSTFCWLGAHCLEKYLKAVLLMNGHSAMSQGHDVASLYGEVRVLVGDLLPENVRRPDWIDGEYWRDQTAIEFIERLKEYGDPDNRYMVHGYAIMLEDIFLLDQMVWAIRRLICRLDEKIVDDPQAPTWRHMLRSSKYRPTLGALPLEELLRNPSKNPSAYDALINRNFELAPGEYRHSGALFSSETRTPVIARHVLEPLEHSEIEYVQDAIATGEWLLENVKFSTLVRKFIRRELDNARGRIKRAKGLTPSAPGTARDLP